jgi:hypothetical protein
MASNDLEVLDPAATVEKLGENSAGRALNRRNLMTAGLGIAGAAIGAGLVSRRSVKRPSVVEAASFASTFTQTDYLNFLLNIKYLQTTFYSYITQGADIPANYTVNGTLYRPTFGTALVNDTLSKVTFTGANAAQITDMLNEIYYDELNQLVNLQSLIGPLGTVAITRPLIDLLGKNTNIAAGAAAVASTITSSKALAQARLLEDLSVTAFAGITEFLTGSNLTAASQILAADGFHAGAIRLAIILQNTATAGTVVDLVGDSDIVPAPGAFYAVQADDVAPVDVGSASASGPGVVATPVQFAATENVINPCTAPIAPFVISGTTYTSCTPTQYQGFFDTTGSATASSNTPPAPGFAFKRTTSQVLSVLYAAGPGATPASPALPSTQVPPLSSVISTGGFFPQGVGGQITII